VQLVWGIAVRVVLAAAFAVLLLSASGCSGLEDALKGEAPAFESVVPEGNGEINGFLSAIGSNESVDASGVAQVARVVDVRWDEGNSDSGFLLTPETELVVHGRDLTSLATNDKAAALAKLPLDGVTTPTYVRYQTIPGSANPDSLAHGYPVALRIEVTAAN